MKNFWNDRYAQEEYAYGKTPNIFVKEKIDQIKLRGPILFPAEGEGRNAVYAASIGKNVFAFDTSHEAYKKAIKLAEEKKTTIQYEVGELDQLHYENGFFEAAFLIFAHFPPKMRKEFHSRISKCIKPGGYVFLEGFSQNNLEFRVKNPSIGGPDQKPMLFTTEDIQSDFKEFEVLELEEKSIQLNEGKFHRGTGSVIRFVGRKPF